LVIDESKTAIKERDLSFTANEADNYALEEALRLKEKHSGEVVAFALGGDEASKVLRACLAMGADRAVHISDSPGLNSYPTPRIITANSTGTKLLIFIIYPFFYLIITCIKT
jgi:electron transfer flavoprotein beta subunit